MRGHAADCPFKCIRDHRTREEKLEDMAAQTEQSPQEAAAAAAALAASRRTGQTPGASVLRERIRQAPSSDIPPWPVKVRYPNGTWHTMDAVDADWRMVHDHRLIWRLIADDNAVNRGQQSARRLAEVQEGYGFRAQEFEFIRDGEYDILERVAYDMWRKYREELGLDPLRQPLA